MRQRDSAQSFSQRADLINLNQYGVGHTIINTALEDLFIRDKQIIPNQLDFTANTIGQQFLAVPVTLVHTVLDRNNRVLVSPGRQVIDKARSVELTVL